MSQRSKHNGNYQIFWADCTGNATYQNLWTAAKAVFRNKFIDLYVYIRRMVINQCSKLLIQEVRRRTSKKIQMKQKGNSKY